MSAGDLVQYGGGPALGREVIRIGLKKREIVDLYPLFLNVYIAGDSGEPIKKSGTRKSFNQTQTFADIVAYAKVSASFRCSSAQLYRLCPHGLRIWSGKGL